MVRLRHVIRKALSFIFHLIQLEVKICILNRKDYNSQKDSHSLWRSISFRVKVSINLAYLKRVKKRYLLMDGVILCFLNTIYELYRTTNLHTSFLWLSYTELYYFFGGGLFGAGHRPVRNFALHYHYIISFVIFLIK